MKTIVIFLLFSVINLFGFEEKNEKILNLISKIEWTGQSSLILNNNKLIFIDPFNISNGNQKADYILITHSHGDHLSIDDIKKVATENTLFYVTEDCIQKLTDAGFSKINKVIIGENYTNDNLEFKVVPAYNVVKTKFHPKENNWVGFLLNIDGVIVYHAGDTERIPEMKEFECDLAFVPLGQTYTMENVEEAVDAVLVVKAKYAIPFHYGMYEGTLEDALKFKEMLDGKVKVLLKEYKKN